MRILIYMNTTTTTRYTVTVRWTMTDGTERTSTNTVTNRTEAARLQAAAEAHYGRDNVIASSYTF